MLPKLRQAAYTSGVRRVRVPLAAMLVAPMLAVAAVVALVAASGLGTPGALDPTFGRRGMVAEPYGTLAAAVAAAVQRNGRIVTVGAAKLSNKHYELVSTRMLPD